MQLQIDQDKKELKTHGSYEFPLRVSSKTLSQYERGSFLWHWHPEVELTLILENEIDYQVNESLYRLRAGEGLFCNANALHTGRMANEEDCLYVSITFHPRLLWGFPGSLIQTRYINRLLNRHSLSSIHFKEDVPWQKQALEHIREIFELSLEKPPLMELKSQILLSQIWLLILEHIPEEASGKKITPSKSMERIRSILSYIHEHYMEHITLEDIADHVHICKSECCRFFKKYMGESLFDYLLYYRIEKSLPLLLEEEKSITEISSLSGFSNPCYFSKVFKKQMNCSPREYRQSKTAL